MELIRFFENEQKDLWLERLERVDWSAAKFLVKLFREGNFLDMLGGEGDLYLLVDGEQIVSFATLTRQDSVRDESLYPWIGFVYTAPAYRGHRYSEKVLEHLENIARGKGFSRIYLATNHVGLYEKYGYTYLENRLDYWRCDVRVLYKVLA